MARNHNDEPVLECLLERDAFREKVLRQILFSDPPKALAVHGTWGTGKTSLLRQMYRQLGGVYSLTKREKDLDTISLPDDLKTEGKEVKAVWFEAWQYQHEENILAALLKEIRDQLAFGYTVLEEAKQVLAVGATSLLQSIDLTIEQFGLKFGGFAQKFFDNDKAYNAERFATPMDAVAMKQMLRAAIDQLLGLKHIMENGFKDEGSKRRVVIFIDDLDRCEPTAAFRILESIKVYLNLDNCIFVFGMDASEVERMLARNSQKQAGEGDSVFFKKQARLYLEKICQDIYHLPVLTPDIKLAYFDKLLEQKECPETLRNTLVTIAKDYNGLPPFARSIKILTNVALAHYDQDNVKDALAEPDEQGVQNHKLFFVLMYLYAFHAELYHLCYLYLHEDFFGQHLVALCKNPKRFQVKAKTEEGTTGTFEVPELHPALQHLKMPDFPGDPLSIDGNTEGVGPTFPHESLRQVLWIRSLIAELDDVTVDELNNMKL